MRMSATEMLKDAYTELLVRYDKAARRLDAAEKAVESHRDEVVALNDEILIMQQALTAAGVEHPRLKSSSDD